jgi:Fe-S-cluster containining protein
VTECRAGCGDCCDPVHLSVGIWQLLTDPEMTYDPESPSGRNAAFVQEHWRPVARSDEQMAVVCDQFDRATRTCRAQGSKPPICSGYPYYGKAPLEYTDRDTAAETMLERCSFRADFDLPIALTRKPVL